MPTVLVTGGSGYIGSHTIVELLNNNYNVITIDNLCNSSYQSIERIEKICGKKPYFVKGDILDEMLLDNIFKSHEISAVIHFAGLKSVSESTEKPSNYYLNNVSGTIALCRSMAKANIYSLVFSSSATVYGHPKIVPVTESHSADSPINPYGRTKLIAELYLKDLASSDARWRIANLRYFNPVGAHTSGLIGEDPCGVPNNLVPYISQVCIGKLEKLSIYGNDYPTPDGTGIRDYIHIMDLADGHLKALNFIGNTNGFHVWNLGTGNGYSVLDVVKAFEIVSGYRIPFTIKDRRPGDIAECWADTSKAANELKWKAKYDIECMMRDTWNWQLKNPKGYRP
ncbi:MULTISPECIES: UDP-glucose 4-epimerase GalE [unclassified Pseudomonas]|uniref:UDP-glucose 4-epimerase GalE n=1 Tax=unclassified Pseudomonas TaxID=196821 RepID=UPI000731B488|nr:MULTISPECIES: UDP-glucose 4-epimerase GalE [unclassified Pseudomonas]KSW23381.1 hypothetical protein AOX63_08310 [Pseudomonas sp. ADP]OBP11908.1 UDP-glucose 4-epimerase GalE [Pseudomonas sp. EGD-AKN5]QOF86330.1 UDP-glucose 4-epimerase GalE [Pseudomonas sp. ADPe]